MHIWTRAVALLVAIICSLSPAIIDRSSAEPPPPSPDGIIPVKTPAKPQFCPTPPQRNHSALVRLDLATPPITLSDLKRGQVFKHCEACPEMTIVAPGTYRMGSPASHPIRAENETPAHSVTINHRFAIGTFEITFDQWAACVSDGACKQKPNDFLFGRATRPVIDVSWADITEDYLPWLRTKTGQPYRLPTEAEWEYAARAGTQTPYATGAVLNKASANTNGRYVIKPKKGQNIQATCPVGSFKPNPWGLYDMHGNVWEWVADCWHKSYNGAPKNGSAWSAGCQSIKSANKDIVNLRIQRGGSWYAPTSYARSASRRAMATEHRGIYTGFRLALTLR